MNQHYTLIKGALVPGHGICDVLISGNRIHSIGQQLLTPPELETADTIDATGLLLWPGLINTHHHIAQSLLKAVPGSLELGLSDWLGAVPYRYWPHYTPECMYAAARIGFSELLAAGCTTCADHHYLYHSQTSPEQEQAVLQAASEIGIRLVLCRGIATVKGSHRGMRSTTIAPESLDLCLQRLQTLVAQHHDTAADAMTRVVVAPTSLVHTCTEHDLRTLAEFARSEGLLLHSHLLEVSYDEQVSREQHGLSAVDYAERCTFLGDDVWFAHLVKADSHAIAKLGATRTGVAHCPTANARLGSGIAPIPALAAAGARVSIGVDGSAAAESGSIVNELLLAFLLHRTQHGANATDAATVMHWSTAAAAQVLGLPETGSLAPGKLADLALFDLQAPRFFGLWQPAFAPVLCGEPLPAKHVMVNGQWKLRDGKILGLDHATLQRDAQQALIYLRQAAA
jgi:8-oxoguanine deaminase